MSMRRRTPSVLSPAPARFLGVVERITAKQFHQAAGIEDWRALGQSACARFRTGTFAAGTALVGAISRLADAANHHPDVDLRYPAVTVRLRTHEVGGLSERDIELARQISAAARELGVPAEPNGLSVVQVGLDALQLPTVQPFWRALLGYREGPRDRLTDPLGAGPALWFQQLDEPRPQRNRMHLDVLVPHDEAEARVAAAIAAGGRLVSDRYAPAWWVLADAEGNEACVSTWLGRD